MQSRSGSSLVASIMAAHGYPTRHSGKTNQFGYTTWEHQEAKQWAYARKAAMNYRNGRFAGYVRGIGDVIRPNDCVKIGIEYWPLFRGLDYKLFCVRRDPEQIARSLREKRGGITENSEQRARAMIGLREAMLDHARDTAGGVDVFPDEIVSGDLSSLERGFAHHGMAFDPGKARACVDVTKWHRR